MNFLFVNKSGMPKLISRTFIGLIALTGLHAGAESIASEWKTRCGITKHSMKSCLEKKGDVVLDGVQGVTHTFTMPNGKSFQWFYPNGTIKCRYENKTKLKTPSGAWFNVYVKCEDEAIVFYLPSGNQAFATAY